MEVRGDPPSALPKSCLSGGYTLSCESQRPGGLQAEVRASETALGVGAPWRLSAVLAPAAGLGLRGPGAGDEASRKHPASGSRGGGEEGEVGGVGGAGVSSELGKCQ